MPYEIAISRKAQRDLEEIADNLTVLGAKIVTYWQKQFDKAIDDLIGHPLRYPIAEEFLSFPSPVRTHQLGRRRNVYQIFYTVEHNIVRVFRVRHAARDSLSEDDL